MKAGVKILYVLGFMFSPDLLSVLLIHKRRPQWQAGLYNGLGGKMTLGESPHRAMAREALEEAGLVAVEPSPWTVFQELEGQDYFIHCLAACGPIETARSMTDEEICIWNTREIHPFETRLIHNLPWLIPMAIDHLLTLRRAQHAHPLPLDCK